MNPWQPVPALILQSSETPIDRNKRRYSWTMTNSATASSSTKLFVPRSTLIDNQETARGVRKTNAAVGFDATGLPLSVAV